MASFRTGYEGLSQAIQGAFDTYYRRKEGQEERKFKGEQGEKDRALRLKEIDQRLRQENLSNEERNRLLEERNKLLDEANTLGRDIHEATKKGLGGYGRDDWFAKWQLTQDEEKGARLDQVKEEAERIRTAVDKIERDIQTEVQENAKYKYGDAASKWKEVPAAKLEKWENENMIGDRSLFYDFVKKQVTDNLIEAYILSEQSRGTGITRDDLRRELADYVTLESTWNQEKYDTDGKDQKSILDDEEMPGWSGDPQRDVERSMGGAAGVGPVPTRKQIFQKKQFELPPAGMGGY